MFLKVSLAEPMRRLTNIFCHFNSTPQFFGHRFCPIKHFEANFNK